MADPAFTEMEAESETFDPRTPIFRSEQAVKSNEEEQALLQNTQEEETSPFLGPPVLTSAMNKTWYNTPSVSTFNVHSDSEVFWLLPAFLLTALSFGSTMAPKINLYSSLACNDYYSERSNLGLPGPLPGGAYPIIEIGQSNPDCHLPEVIFNIHR
jgi:hypothetical protein